MKRSRSAARPNRVASTCRQSGSASPAGWLAFVASAVAAAGVAESAEFAATLIETAVRSVVLFGLEAIAIETVALESVAIEPEVFDLVAPEWLVLVARLLVARVVRAAVRFCLLYTSPSPRDATLSRMPSSA